MTIITNTSSQEQNKDKENLKALITIVEQSLYMDIPRQIEACKSFNIPYKRSIFSKVYRKRFVDFLLENITTMATINAQLGIPEKYLTTVKTDLEKQGLLRVVGTGICPTTGSRGVNFITTNESWFYNPSLLPKGVKYVEPSKPFQS